MAISAQDKILHVANKLGLTTLKNMQGTTRLVYDKDATPSDEHLLFANVSKKSFPDTNVSSGNRFEVNEALLIEQIGFFIPDPYGGYLGLGPGNTSVKFDLVIGNKTVIKDFVVEPGGQAAFYSTGQATAPFNLSSVVTLEGAGILIPPQVEWYVRAYSFNNSTREPIADSGLGCYLFGTGVLLNFNTTI